MHDDNFSENLNISSITSQSRLWSPRNVWQT